MAAVDCPVLNQAAGRPTELDDLQDHALGQIGMMQADAQAEADALQGEGMAQFQDLQQQAQAKADALKGRADALRNRAMGLQNEATSKATGLRDQAMAKATGLRDQAISQATGMRDQAMSKVTDLQHRVTGLRDQAMQMQSRAQAYATQLQNAPEMAKAKAFATAGAMRDQMTGMLQVPPAVSALMQESAAEPLPEKERAREQDLAPFEEGEEPPREEPQQDEKPMSLETWLMRQLQRRLQLHAERAAAAARQAAAGAGLPDDLPPPPDEDFDLEGAMRDELDRRQRQMQAEQEQMEQSLRDMHPQAPPFDGETAGALAGFGQCSDMLKDLIGKSLLDDNGLGEMQELVGSFGDCMAAVPPIDPAQLNAMNVAGAMALAVEQVRAKFNVDLLQQGAGAQLAGLLSKARSFDPSSLREAAARRAAQWLPLASFAKSVSLPVNGAGALGRLGAAAKWMQTVPMPDPGKAAAGLMSHMSSAAAVKRVFGADPFAKGAAAALAPKLERVRANAEEAMSKAQGAARQAQGIAGQLSRSSVSQAAKIARGQARDLALGKIRHAATPMLAKAMPVLATLQSVRQATGQRVTLPGKGSWRRK